MIRGAGLLLALAGAVANAYPADLSLRDRLPTLRASQSERRAAAWETAKRVLEPVKVDYTFVTSTGLELGALLKYDQLSPP